MPDDWEWFWAGEGGRDSLLRTEIEGLHSQASAARSQAALRETGKACFAHRSSARRRALPTLAPDDRRFPLLRCSLDKAEARVQQLESARQRTVEETQQLAVALRDRLAAPVG